LTPGAPDILGLELPRAREALEAAGWAAEVVFTAPPRGGQGLGVPRILRARVTAPDRVQLVAACPRFEPARRGD
jgi:hypothetical protein